MTYPVELVTWPYRLTITSQRAATLFSFFADTADEAACSASRLVAAAGEDAVCAVLTCDGRRVAKLDASPGLSTEAHPKM